MSEILPLSFRNIETAIGRLYVEVDIPPPSESFPIAPLGPILRLLMVGVVEVAGLTRAKAEDSLRQRRVISGSLELDAEPNTLLAGFLYAVGEGGFLFVDSSEKSPITRRRFSVAHELGHLILHFRPALGDWQTAITEGRDVPPALLDAFSDTQATATEDGGNVGGAFDRRETEADRFAACLLMPADVVRARTESLKMSFPALSETGMTERLALDLLVSYQAMNRRLRGLGIVRPAGETAR
jgi:hypothetical protein